MATALHDHLLILRYASHRGPAAAVVEQYFAGAIPDLTCWPATMGKVADSNYALDVVAAALVMCASPESEVDVEAWRTLSAVAVREAVALVRATLLDHEQRILAFIGRLGARDLALSRRFALLLHRANRGDYWAAYFFVAGLPPRCTALRFRAVGALLRQFPAAVGRTAKLLTETEAPAGLPSGLMELLTEMAQRHPAVQWDAIFLAQVFERAGQTRLAYRILKRGFRLENDDYIRFRNVQLAAQLAARLLGPRAELRLLVTALRILPGYVGTKALLERMAFLGQTVSGTGVTDSAEAFHDDQAGFYRGAGAIDVAEWLQARLQLPSRLRPEERALPGRRRLAGVSAVVIPASSVEFSRLPVAGELAMGQDPWSAIPECTSRAKRLEVRRATLEGVYLATFAHAMTVFDREGQLVREFSSGSASIMQFNKLRRAGTTPLSGHFFNCSVSFGHNNYSHFLLDRIPQLMFCEDLHDRPRILVDADSRDWTQHLLDAADIAAELVAMEQNRLYELESVTLLTVPQHPLQTGYPPYVKFLNRLAIAAGRTASRGPCIVVHRAKGRRGIDNEAEFYAYMLQQGFQIVDFAGHSIADQLEIMRRAELVVGIHGAGLSNAAVCRPGTKLIEILPVGYYIPTFLIMAKAAGLQYWPYIEASARNWELATRQQFSDTAIDMAAWRPFLAKVIRHTAES